MAAVTLVNRDGAPTRSVSPGCSVQTVRQDLCVAPAPQASRETARARGAELSRVATTPASPECCVRRRLEECGAGNVQQGGQEMAQLTAALDCTADQAPAIQVSSA